MLHPLIRPLTTLVVAALVVTACSPDDGAGRQDQLPVVTEPATVADVSEDVGTRDEPGYGGAVQPCADVIAARIVPRGDGSYRIDATVQSGDNGWDKYADAWEVRTPEGDVLGVRLLAHPHETEQPFTRSLSPVEIDPSIEEVVLVARDSVNGFCGEPLRLVVPG